jgi:hypothetical protein
VSGVSLPGTPSVIVGHNQRIAWGVTNLHFDVQDLYIENFDPATGRYLYRGQWEQARQEREIIPVKGAPAVEMPLWITRHGPLYIDDAKEHLALRWAAAEPGSFQFPFPELNGRGTGRSSRGRCRAFPARAELRVCGCGRQHRLSRHGALADPQGVYGRRAGGWIVGRERVARLHSVR